MSVLILSAAAAVLSCLGAWVAVLLGKSQYYPVAAAPAAVLAFGVAAFVSQRGLTVGRETFALSFAVFMAQLSGFSMGNIDIFNATVFLLAVFWTVQTLAESERRIQTSPVLYLLFALLFLSVLAFVNSPPLSGVIMLAEKVALFFIVVDIFRGREAVKTVRSVIIAAGVFSSLVAFAQFIVFMGWGYLFTIGAPEDPITFLKPTPLGLMPRATGFFPTPAGLNDFLIFALGVALFSWGGEEGRSKKALRLGCALLFSSAVVLTWSASSFVILLGMAFLFLYLNKPARAIHYTSVSVFAAVVLYVTGLASFMLDFFKEYGAAAGVIRMDLLELGMEAISRSPWIGLGIGNFQNFSRNIFQEGPYLFHYPVHNAFMQTMTDMGIFGGVILVLIVLMIGWRTLTMIWTLPGKEKNIFKGFFLGLTGVAVHMFSEPMAYEGTLWLLLALTEGALVAWTAELGIISNEEGGGVSSRRSP